MLTIDVPDDLAESLAAEAARLKWTPFFGPRAKVESGGWEGCGREIG
jgi:hypothetical protein